ncbi:hypothetical protein PALI_a0781 [Pseudoalteromonas aliena SW19]|uniref:Uncharacterized protein n=1 Tax=Pseudoalteromonas aliena SW19 TaxID=1314866 RepID=A0ABR9DZF7_9GAMM|nr:hypothetical protein [Pseudoalteromonas aliena SW19]
MITFKSIKNDVCKGALYTLHLALLNNLAVCFIKNNYYA